MRILLQLYVLIFLVLNVMFNNSIIFFFAIAAFPVSLYLLLSKPAKKQPVNTRRNLTQKVSYTFIRAVKKEEAVTG